MLISAGSLKPGSTTGRAGDASAARVVRKREKPSRIAGNDDNHHVEAVKARRWIAGFQRKLRVTRWTLANSRSVRTRKEIHHG